MMAMAVALAMVVVMAMVMVVAAAVVMAVVMVMVMAVAVAVAVVNFKECKNDLDDSRICCGGVVHGLPTFGSAIRLLSLPAG
jgi:membrane protein YdbS with pleckstrin-like domain